MERRYYDGFPGFAAQSPPSARAGATMERRYYDGSRNADQTAGAGNIFSLMGKPGTSGSVVSGFANPPAGPSTQRLNRGISAGNYTRMPFWNRNSGVANPTAGPSTQRWNRGVSAGNYARMPFWNRNIVVGQPKPSSNEYLGTGGFYRNGGYK